MTYPGSPDHDPYLTPADKARKQRIALGWQGYDGKLESIFKAPTDGQPDLRTYVNLCKPIVRTSVAFLFGQPVKIAVETAGNADETPQGKSNPAQEYLDGALGDQDDLMTLLSEFAMNGAVSGHAFIKLITPDDNGTDYPSLVVLDPATITVQSDPDNVKVAQSYCIEYDVCGDDGKTYTKRQIIQRIDPDGLADVETSGVDQDAHWEITNWQRQGDSGGFTQVGEPIPWRFPWSPIEDNQHLPMPNSYWGEAAVSEDIIHLNIILNAVKTNTNTLIFHHAHPIPWADADSINNMPVEPGRWVGFPQGTSVGVIAASGDLASSMEFEKGLRADIAQLGSIPSIASGRVDDMPRGQLSGVALRTDYAPLLTLTTHGRRLYGRTIRRVCQHILELGGFQPDLKITLTWADPLPVDDLELAQTALAMEQAGASTAEGLRKMGLDPVKQAQEKQDEAQDQMTAFAQGQGLPPVPALPDGNEPSTGNGGNTIDPNNPAAVAARAKMQAAFS